MNLIGFKERALDCYYRIYAYEGNITNLREVHGVARQGPLLLPRPGPTCMRCHVLRIYPAFLFE